MKIRTFIFLGCLMGLFGMSRAEARYDEDQKKSQVQDAKEDQATLTARLIDEKKNAAQGAASVEVNVSGIEIIDPKMGSSSGKGQGHLHYQVDDGIIIATTAPKLSFHALSPGEHKITVSLANNQHLPLGPKSVLTVMIPREKTIAY